MLGSKDKGKCPKASFSLKRAPAVGRKEEDLELLEEGPVEGRASREGLGRLGTGVGLERDGGAVADPKREADKPRTKDKTTIFRGVNDPVTR